MREDPEDQAANEYTYVIDSESAAEVARLMYQDRLLTQFLGGVFPEHRDLANVNTILDLACGPGGWVLDVAHEHPTMKVTGVDISRIMVEYARAQAHAQGLQNTDFRLMDVTGSLDFPDNTFDLVNARFLIGFMAPDDWPKLLRECLRVTRPGGVIRLTEGEWCTTTSPAAEQLASMLTRALNLAKRSFSPDGRTISITPMLGPFLRQAGCTGVQTMAHAIDFSAGAEAHVSMYQNLMAATKLVEPFLVKMGITSEETFERIYQQSLAEMLADDFSGIWFYLSAWGEKPT